MKHIIRNYKPYWPVIILIALLLAVQAYTDLTLPTYTSDIIDVGIQNSGLQHIVPEAVNEDEFSQTEIFMTDSEKKLWESLYQKDGGVYRLAETDNEKLTEADDALMTSIVLNYQLSHTEESTFKEIVAGAMKANPMTEAFADKVKDMSIDEISALSGMEISSFEAENEAGGTVTYVDMRSMMKQMMDSGMMDSSMVEQSRAKMAEMVESLGSRTLKSMGVQFAASCDKAAGLDMKKIQMNYLWKECAQMLGLAVIGMIAAILVSLLSSRVGAGIGRTLRSRVFGQVMSYSNAEISRFSSASLITRATNDVQQIQMVSIMMLRMVLFAPMMGIGGVLKVAHTGAGMAWIVALAVVVLIGFMMLLLAVAMPKFKIMQEMVDRLNLVSREILTGLSVIRAFGRETREEERFDVANDDLRKTQLFTNRVMAFMMPGMMMLMNVLVISIMWVGAKHIDAGTLQVGALTAFISYSMQIVISFLMITVISIMLPRAGVAAERINEVLVTPTSVAEKEETAEMKSHNGVVSFNHVNFRYPGADENVLEDIDFTAEPGKVTAIIGSTGCGKSTLVNLLPRFYDVSEGSITLDGVDIRDLSLKDLRHEIGFVPQKGVLFSGTIDSNLRFGNADAPDEVIIQAAEIAQAADFINEKEGKYDSPIAQGGSNVSGGQKQRLAIARAIAKEPRIFVFDDSFSALDMKTDAMLRAALEERVKDCTEIIVAQRISTILHADQIIVLDEGRIVGKGTHEELLRNCEVYLQIAESQLSRKELGLDDTEGGEK